MPNKFPVILYGVDPKYKSTIEAVMAQFGVEKCDFIEHPEKRTASLRTVIPEVEVKAEVSVVVIKPVNDYLFAVKDLARRIKDTVIVCEMSQEPHRVIMIAVNDKDDSAYPSTKMMTFLPE